MARSPPITAAKRLRIELRIPAPCRSFFGQSNPGVLEGRRCGGGARRRHPRALSGHPPDALVEWGSGLPARTVIDQSDGPRTPKCPRSSACRRIHTHTRGSVRHVDDFICRHRQWRDPNAVSGPYQRLASVVNRPTAVTAHSVDNGTLATRSARVGDGVTGLQPTILGRTHCIASVRIRPSLEASRLGLGNYPLNSAFPGADDRNRTRVFSLGSRSGLVHVVPHTSVNVAEMRKASTCVCWHTVQFGAVVTTS